jgi:hypothetical protein
MGYFSEDVGFFTPIIESIKGVVAVAYLKSFLKQSFSDIPTLHY